MVKTKTRSNQIFCRMTIQYRTQPTQFCWAQATFLYRKSRGLILAHSRLTIFCCAKWFWCQIYSELARTLSLFADLQSYSYGSQQITGLRTSNEAFFHWNPELLGLGRQIGQINSGAFGSIFRLNYEYPFWYSESLVHVFHYSTIGPFILRPHFWKSVEKWF